MSSFQWGKLSESTASIFRSWGWILLTMKKDGLNILGWMIGVWKQDNKPKCQPYVSRPITDYFFKLIVSVSIIFFDSSTLTPHVPNPKIEYNGQHRLSDVITSMKAANTKNFDSRIWVKYKVAKTAAIVKRIIRSIFPTLCIMVFLKSIQNYTKLSLLLVIVIT